MPALTETQTPLLERDRECGLVPDRFKEEKMWQYHIRLAQLYGLKSDEVERILGS